MFQMAVIWNAILLGPMNCEPSVSPSLSLCLSLTPLSSLKGTYTVLLGAHSLNNREDTQQEFGIAALYPHPRFSMSYDNDIVLLKVTGSTRQFKGRNGYC